MGTSADPSRLETVLAMVRDGMTYSAIGRSIGVSTQRIGQLLNPIKHTAREAVRVAIERGDVIRPSACQGCLAPGPVHGHHHDYLAPLDVRWLCQKCHAAAHRALPLDTTNPAAALGSLGGRAPRQYGRPSLSGKGDTASFPVRLPAPLVKRAKAHAQTLGISRAELVRRALVAFLT